MTILFAVYLALLSFANHVLSCGDRVTQVATGLAHCRCINRWKCCRRGRETCWQRQSRTWVEGTVLADSPLVRSRRVPRHHSSAPSLSRLIPHHPLIYPNRTTQLTLIQSISPGATMVHAWRGMAWPATPNAFTGNNRFIVAHQGISWQGTLVEEKDNSLAFGGNGPRGAVARGDGVECARSSRGWTVLLSEKHMLHPAFSWHRPR